MGISNKLKTRSIEKVLYILTNMEGKMKTEMRAIWMNRMHQTFKVVILFLFLAGTSCRNNPVGPNNASNNFSVKVDVKDSNGHPVQGI